MHTRNATAMVIGGGQWQMAIIRRAREMGLSTVVTDRSAEAPGRDLADRFFQVDGTDREALLAVARHCTVDLVLAEATDRHVPIAAYLNQQLGLNGIMPETARRFTNKYAMRQALKDLDVAMPRYAEVASLGAAQEYASAWGYPLVVKPKTLQSSLGVYRVDTTESLSTYFPLALCESTDGAILLEEFIEGPEITVEALSITGTCHVLAISEKEHYKHNPCVARRLAYPPPYPDALLATIATAAQKVVESLGLHEGISHAEYRLRNGIPYLIEVAARGGGNAIASTIVPHVSGVDIYELLIKVLLNQPVAMPEPLHRAAALQFLDLPAGAVTAIHGLEQIQRSGLAQEIKLSFSPGETIKDPLNDTARVGYFIALGKSRDEVDARCARITELLNVQYA